MRHLLVVPALLAACAPSTEPLRPATAEPRPWSLTPLHPVDEGADDSVQVDIARDGDDGPFTATEVERFVAVVDGGEVDPDSIVWSASDGEIQTDGMSVDWTLPDHTAEALLSLDLTVDGEPVHREFSVSLIAVAPGATGVIDASADAAGDSCDLAIDGTDTPHVIYADWRHGQWVYARFNGSAWVRETLDGPGFLTGGLATGEPSIAVDRNNKPHVAFARTGGTVVYANKVSGSWVLETVATEAYSYSLQVGLVLDTFNSDAPIVIDTDDTPAVRVSRKNPGWVSQVSSLTGYDSADRVFRGGVALTASGTIRFSFDDDTVYVAQWSTSGGFSGSTSVYTSYNGNKYTRMPVAKAGNGLMVLAYEGLEYSANGTTGWATHDVEYFDLDDASDLAWDGTRPRIALEHDGRLELIRPDALGYWTYTIADTGIEGGMLSTALDASGNLHACYRKNGRLYFY